MPPANLSSGLSIGGLALHEARLWAQDYLFGKVDLRPGRLVASAIVFSFLFLAATVLWGRIQRVAGWLLFSLGQHALYAYTAHVILVSMIAVAVRPFNLGFPGPQWLNALIQLASVLLIWALLRWHLLAPTPSTQRYWHASPALLAVIAIIAFRLDPSPTQPGVQSAAIAAAGAGAVAPAARVPSRFGTPLPKDVAQAPAKAPAAAGTPVPPQAPPTPAVPWKVVISADALTRIGEFVDEDIQGTLQERWFYSPELDRDMPYWIYLPRDYGTGRRYPTLYMLHGLGGHRDEWIVYGLINVADRAIRTGDIPPMIIVLPQGDKEYWVDHANDGPRWGQYITRDLVRHVDLTYRTSALRECARHWRAVDGRLGGVVHRVQPAEYLRHRRLAQRLAAAG